MAVSSSSFRLFSLILTWLSLANLVISQSCFNQSTAINGKPFPPLIEATTEDLAVGLESGLFTSVDLVKVRLHTPTRPTTTHHFSSGIYRPYHGAQLDVAYGDSA
jgi:hypothetical protein